MKSMSLIWFRTRNGDGFNDDKQPEDGQRPHGDIHRTAVCILFRCPGVSIMKRIGQMNQFVESAKEESGQKVTFARCGVFAFGSAGQAHDITTGLCPTK